MPATSSNNNHGENKKMEIDNVPAVITCCTRRPMACTIRPVRGLYACPFQPVVEHRILVGHQAQVGSVFHDLDADVAGVLVRQERVQIVDASAQDASAHRESKFSGHQPPQRIRYCFVGGNCVDDAVHNELGDPHATAMGTNENQEAENHAEGNDSGTGLPDDPEDRRHVAQRREAFPPAAPEVVALSHLSAPWVSLAVLSAPG